VSLSSADLTHLIAATVLLLVAAHGLGRLFAWFRQPRVAGEILGGLLLGPTLFGLVAPDWQRAVFQGGAATRAGLGSATSSACCCSCTARVRSCGSSWCGASASPSWGSR
jgi:hypothetical protein